MKNFEISRITKVCKKIFNSFWEHIMSSCLIQQKRNFNKKGEDLKNPYITEMKGFLIQMCVLSFAFQVSTLIKCFSLCLFAEISNR